MSENRWVEDDFYQKNKRVMGFLKNQAKTSFKTSRDLGFLKPSK